MARLKDVQFSQMGETQESEGSLHQEEVARMAVLDNPPTTETRYHIFKLVDTKKKGGTYIPNIDDVINPETGKEERMRLLSGVQSIWIKDQKNVEPDYVKQNAKSNARTPKSKLVMSISTIAFEFCGLAAS
jgi:hypothetical protein